MCLPDIIGALTSVYLLQNGSLCGTSTHSSTTGVEELLLADFMTRYCVLCGSYCSVVHTYQLSLFWWDSPYFCPDMFAVPLLLTLSHFSEPLGLAVFSMITLSVGELNIVEHFSPYFGSRLVGKYRCMVLASPLIQK